jgi:pimeloyl-ACP methyl ester carboxylesterase
MKHCNTSLRVLMPWLLLLLTPGAVLAESPSKAGPQAPQPVRTESFVASDSGVRIFVREVRDTSRPSSPVPILLVHGARAPGVASFDLPVPGGSLAADLAAAGHRVFLMDARGYGKSTRPAHMDGTPSQHAPLVRSDEVVRDVAAVVEWIRQHTGAPRVALFGWATGGHWAGMYSALYPDKVSHLILDNSLYGGVPQHPSLGKGSDLEDPKMPGRFNAAAMGAYRLSTGPSLVTMWERNIPVADKDSWRDPAVSRAYIQAALESDSTSASRNPPSLRAPTGALEDSFYLATGRQLWDGSLVTAATLILRGELDFWSRPEDAQLLESHLVHAARVKRVTIPQATHFVHLDRPEHGRAQLVREILEFVSQQVP